MLFDCNKTFNLPKSIIENQCEMKKVETKKEASEDAPTYYTGWSDTSLCDLSGYFLREMNITQHQNMVIATSRIERIKIFMAATFNK